ncbi:AraC family transcriptional regulator [Clostridium grantii]|uniref:AraC-type DNA-binding protein n=1 Tax=Clostridium grantii DSM 8605 TaxID=1121316 RepID=A0A1M5SVP4_9CLOT|nr:AraC family transcriptional regulator [Clostridium grantii]SHH42536.1 AraC-type DNA-binding protein [Clostridium grantii DSM 8605]
MKDINSQNKTKTINLIDINPYVRRASKHLIQAGYDSAVRLIPHYQIQYICSGIGIFIINGKQFECKKGDLLFWGPGDEHTIKSDIDKPMTVFGVQFDFTQNNNKNDYVCRPYTKETFCTELIEEYIKFEDHKCFPHYIDTKDMYIGESYLTDIVNEFQHKGLYFRERISGLFKAFLILSMQNNYNVENNHSKEIINKIINYLQENYKKDISNKTVGELFKFHPNYLNRLMVRYTEMSIQQYLINIRINRSMDLLQNSNKTISEIAYISGFKSAHYFSRLFKKKVGLNPSDFR